MCMRRPGIRLSIMQVCVGEDEIDFRYGGVAATASAVNTRIRIYYKIF